MVDMQQSRLMAIRGILQQNQDLLRNAGSLAATTGLTSVFGFAYWIYAAHVFPQQAVGYGSAAISTMTLLGTIGMFGIGTMLIGELPRRESRGGLIMAGLVVSFAGSLILGVGFAIVSLAFGNRFAEIGGTFGRMAIFCFGVAITGATVVFDEATIGLMRGGIQLTRNVVVSIAKMAALPCCALILHDLFGVGIELSWVLGTLVSIVPIIIIIRRDGTSILYRPDWGSFRRLGKVTLAHNWLNLAINIPPKLIPVLVVIVVSPSSNAVYYVAAMLVGFLGMVPTHLSTVLFAIASAAPERISEKLRFVLRASLMIGVPGGLILGLSGHFVLSIFGSSYARLGTGPLWLLIVCLIPGIPNIVYIAVCRATGRVSQAAVFLSIASAIQMSAVVVGGRLDGLYGLCYGMLAVATLQALVTTPAVLRAAYGSGAWVHSASVSATEGDRLSHIRALDDGRRLRQEAGIAALLALATTVTPDQRRPHGAVDVRSATVARMTPTTRTTRQASTDHNRGRHRHSVVPVTAANPAPTDTSWSPGDDEAAFRARQRAGMAALLAIATHAARV
ncbi:lipopolysaccharide biosynthesis protein [Trebonia kvetii]|uniref:Lipopolysaccharide biosynthesis protein n=1 Tax=Trebonia kvetii TaxID=2480626 RepID=A0A6P2C9R8_9ACTN|nr:lipopolysaccharide biosynthesis protein [Trebonia kvetii]TVZ07106.1 lipopolysaccharide biosynthesis protein [Trebonia kvetii]